MSTLVPCPAWCVNPECNTDHWPEPGCDAWPAIQATAWPSDGTPSLTPHPTWGEIDGLEPAVSLWLESHDCDKTIDLTPDEAEALATQLLAAVKAARSSQPATSS